MSEYGDLDDFDPEDYNYFYVEDEYPLAVRSSLLDCAFGLINVFSLRNRTT